MMSQDNYIHPNLKKALQNAFLVRMKGFRTGESHDYCQSMKGESNV